MNAPQGRHTRTIIFVNRFFHPDLSATSQLLSDLAFHLAVDHHVIVITSRLRYDNDDARLPSRASTCGVQIRRVTTTGFGRAGLVGRAIDLASFHAAALVAMIGQARRGDVIVAMTDPPLLSVIASVAARVRGARVVNWLQDIYPEAAVALGVRGLGGVWGRGLRWLRDRSLRTGDNVVLGERMAAHLAAVGVPAVRVIPNWTDDSAITPLAHPNNPLRTRWGLQNRFVVGYSGNLGRAHEYDTILGAARLLAGEPDIVFLMIGDGHRTASLRAAAKATGLANIVFQPYQSQCDLVAALASADVHWISLRPQLEGLVLPSKVYGVLAVGRPVIAVTARDGEIARLVTAHGCGLQVDPGDAEGFVRAVRALVADPALTAHLGTAARAAAAGPFSRALALARWRATLEEISAQSSGAERQDD